jgi:hypothetical protein
MSNLSRYNVWENCPPSHELIPSFAETFDSQVWVVALSLVGSSHRILELQYFIQLHMTFLLELLLQLTFFHARLPL